MCCFLFLVPMALTACDPVRVVVPAKLPPERIDCVAVTERPAITPEYIIDWDKIISVYAAQREHNKYVATVRSRENVISGYLVAIENELFMCSNDAQWLRDYNSNIID